MIDRISPRALKSFFSLHLGVVSVVEFDVISVVVAGGSSRRMGGRDKLVQNLFGRPLIGHVWTAITPQVVQIALNINRQLPLCLVDILPKDVTVLTDSKDANYGPLSGVLTGLLWAESLEHIRKKTVYLLTVPSDTPFLPKDLVMKLTYAMHSYNARAVYSRSGGRIQPLIALWSTKLLLPLVTFLDGGCRSVSSFLGENRSVIIDYPTVPIDPFLNINTVTDLQEVERNGQLSRIF